MKFASRNGGTHKQQLFKSSYGKFFITKINNIIY